MRSVYSLFFLISATLFNLGGVSAQSIIGGEYFFDIDPGVGNGSFVSLPNSGILNTNLSISTGNLTPGPHNLGLRLKDNQGKWSHYEMRTFYVYSLTGNLQSGIIGGEWFIDADPGFGNGHYFSISPNANEINQNISFDMSSLSLGTHYLYVRCKNSQGKWSHYEQRLFYVYPNPALNNGSPIVSGEWFVDADPGLGNGVSFSLISSSTINGTADFSVLNLTAGSHILYLRVKNADGKWTHYEGRNFNVINCIPSIEICNAMDDDCDGIVDNGLTFLNYYPDIDGDSYGAGNANSFCSNPGTGYVTNNFDCNATSISIHPNAIEICGNGIDEDCSGSDLTCNNSGNFSSEGIVTIGNYGLGVQTTLNVDFNQGSNQVESIGDGIDKWFQFTAQSNAIRLQIIGSVSAADDNQISLYNYTTSLGQPLIPIDQENDVTPAALGISTDGGNEVLYYDQLVVGNVYWICVQNVNHVFGTTTLKIAYLCGSTMDIGPYTGYTNVYNSTCQNFKCKYRPYASYYTFNLWNGNTVSSTPYWSYSTTPVVSGTAGTVVQLGKLIGANFGITQVQHSVLVDVHYSLPDAFGNLELVTGLGVHPEVFALNPEADLNLRSSDRCPVYKTYTSGSIATNRSVCGTSRYLWQFAMNAPSVGLPQLVSGSLGGSRVLSMTSILGITYNQQYGVRIASLHNDMLTQSAFGTSQCMRTIGFAGAPQVTDDVDWAVWQNAFFGFYPNPNNGQSVNFAVSGMEGDLNVRITDATGRMVYANRYIVEGSLNTTIDFGQSLAGGVYMVEMIQNEKMQTMRMVVEK